MNLNVFGQFNNCVNPARIQPFYQCNDVFYNPVCGCNNVTYRNQCEALNVYGVENWYSGVCSGIHLDIYPNPVGPSSPISINVSHSEFINGNLDIKIIDLYGKVWYQNILNNVNRINLQIDLSSLRTGIYMVFVTSSVKAFQVKKISKY